MENKFQTSFIPKTPLVADQHAGSSHSSMSFLTLASLIVFVLSILGAICTFGWTKILLKQQAEDQATLKSTREAFDPALIQELKAVNNRIDAAKALLASHTAVSGLFDIIQALTLQSVRFKQFTYEYNTKGIKLTMSGEATSFTAIALQSDVFGKNQMIKNPILSNLTLGNNGSVTFDFSGTVDPSILAYSKSKYAPGVSATTTPQ